MEPLTIAVLGATGRVGRRVVAHILASEDLELQAAVCGPDSAALYEDAGRLAGVGFSGLAVGPLEPGCFGEAEVVIDFSLPGALLAALPFLDGAALVSGTTGLSAEEEALVAAHAARAPVVRAANFSTGVTVLLDLVARAAAALPEADVEIVESHHRGKLDAPSGTALALARAAAAARGQALDEVACYGRVGRGEGRALGEIGIHALRMGDVVGEHEVWIAGQGDRVRLGHVATSRDTFALGALRAARWARGKDPASYTMRDVLGLP
jgi:4-hydroxy-tetrahydrodipicolinate reductase